MKALVLLFLLVLAPDADARCAPLGLRVTITTPANTTIPADGGIVVAAASGVDRDMTKGDVKQTGWRFRDGELLVEPTIDVIAPGLAVYRYPAAKGKLELEDDDHAVVATMAMTNDKPALLAAPRVKKIVSTKSLGRRGSTIVEVVLDGAAPATAVAIVAVGANGRSLSFGTVAAGQKLVIYEQQRCLLVSNGTIEPRAGERVTVFWVDAMGRKSPATKPIAITDTKSRAEK